MKIKAKFTISLSIVFIVLLVAINFITREVLMSNMESTVYSSLKEVMSSTREYVKYRLIIDELQSNEEGLKKEADNIISYITVNYNCDSQVRNMNGDVFADSGNKGFEKIIEKGIKNSKGKKAIVNINYGKGKMKGILTYPIYIDSSYLGIVVINKDYTYIYNEYRNTIRFTTIIETIVFLIVFIILFFIIRKITKPISKLTDVVNKVGNGDYNASVEVKSNDEVGILSKSFMEMKNKIQHQIEDIKLQKSKVEKLEKSRVEFFNNVTHELKTPLTAISGYAEMIKDDVVDDEEFKKRAVERIYSESERLHKLVLDLIDVSKGISYIEEEWVQLEMKGIIDQICDDMNMKSKKYSLRIDKDIKEGYILGQNSRIREVLINIIDNAIKYSHINENIIVKGYIEKDMYVIDVINKGDSIPDRVYDNIFEPFVKSKDSIEEKEKSRGLGLYICSEIIREHDGSINIENGEVIKVSIKIPSVVNKLETSNLNLEKI